MGNKIAIITGASRGIGKAVALDLSQQGYQVMLIAESEKDLERVQSEVESIGQVAEVYAVDVSEVDQVEACIEGIISKHGRIDVLFNNAGIMQFGSIEISNKVINQLIGVNLLGAIHVAKTVAIQMKKQHHGYIINLSSKCGKQAMPYLGVYAASKFGLVGYGEALFKELMPHHVKVTTICPGMVRTEMTRGFELDQSKMIGADDIVKTIRYLLGLGENAAIKEIEVDCSWVVAQEAMEDD